MRGFFKTEEAHVGAPGPDPTLSISPDVNEVKLQKALVSDSKKRQLAFLTYAFSVSYYVVLAL